MKHRIWKFELSTAPTAGLIMPAGAKVLTVAAQGERVCIWALCDPDAPKENRDFTILGTGFSAPPDASAYLGTAHTTDGFVWHVFEGLV